MERGLVLVFSPPLRRVERGPGGEVNYPDRAISTFLTHPFALIL
jgi:hypothetical protein